jgi:hypothetical protein
LAEENHAISVDQTENKVRIRRTLRLHCYPLLLFKKNKGDTPMKKYLLMAIAALFLTSTVTFAEDGAAGSAGSDAGAPADAPKPAKKKHKKKKSKKKSKPAGGDAGSGSEGGGGSPQ